MQTLTSAGRPTLSPNLIKGSQLSLCSTSSRFRYMKHKKSLITLAFSSCISIVPRMWLAGCDESDVAVLLRSFSRLDRDLFRTGRLSSPAGTRVSFQSPESASEKNGQATQRTLESEGGIRLKMFNQGISEMLIGRTRRLTRNDSKSQLRDLQIPPFYRATLAR